MHGLRDMTSMDHTQRCGGRELSPEKFFKFVVVRKDLEEIL